MRFSHFSLATLLLSLATAAALSAQAPIERAAGPRPVPGVFVHSAKNAYVRTVSINADHTELRVEHGVANIRVDHPAEGSLILVDLPGGQVDLLKDGFYTFNADTNTFRVMDGEATAYATGNSAKEIKVKSAQEVVFDAHPHAADFERSQARADLVPYDAAPRGEYANGGGYGEAYVGDAPYGYGYYAPYPYYAYGYPYGYYGWGWGYPYYGYGWGLGLGFYGGGFYGYRGGFGGYHSGFGGGRGFGHR